MYILKQKSTIDFASEVSDSRIFRGFLNLRRTQSGQFQISLRTKPQVPISSGFLQLSIPQNLMWDWLGKGSAFFFRRFHQIEWHTDVNTHADNSLSVNDGPVWSSLSLFVIHTFWLLHLLIETSFTEWRVRNIYIHCCSFQNTSGQNFRVKNLKTNGSNGT